MPNISALGLDTSNYTTSAAFFGDGEMDSRGMILPVKEGEIGLRQSDAVFHHTRQLPEVLSMLGDKIGGAKVIGVSERPRDAKNSYMPCFLVGIGAAQMLSQALGVPLRRFSHQQGHIAAALYSVNRLDLLHERFLAFHMSGGTTEAVLVEPVEGGKMFRTRLVASSLDLKAGQVIDRIGVMLGLPFPAGKHLDPIACGYTEKLRVRASMKGANCSLSGVENKCRELMKKGAPKEEIAVQPDEDIFHALCRKAASEDRVITLWVGESEYVGRVRALDDMRVTIGALDFFGADPADVPLALREIDMASLGAEDDEMYQLLSDNRLPDET